MILPPDLVQELLSDAIEPDTPGLIRSVLTPSEMAELKALMPEASASAPIAAEPVLTSRESAALRAATMPAEQWVPVALVLPSDPFAWHVY
ncbi:MAG: hypothetical protein MUF64_18990, partial [Polyangiaceae bacterium]|nr:hypothetical protein [Polyangiaceae bacterium]